MALGLRLIEAANFLGIQALTDLMHPSIVTLCKEICMDRNEILKAFGPCMTMKQSGATDECVSS